MAQATTLDVTSSRDEERAREPDVAMLVVAWSSSEPRRVGEVLVPRADGEPAIFGRGDAEAKEPRAQLIRQRPGGDERTPSLDNPFLSRRHFALRSEDGGVAIDNLGKRALLHDGRPAGDELLVQPGETVEIQSQLVLACVLRPRVMPPLGHLATTAIAAAFGEPDVHGFVGESPRAWKLRDQCALVASLSAHALLLGESGTGKELAAQAIHAQSTRRAKALVARNAATFPAGLVDSELFGNIAGYPNPGMPERPGVIGEADGSTLFLDEIAEMPHDLQSHLLRVLDDAGEYTRLGDARRRTADLRVVAATNRPVEQLKHDLAARLGLRITLPALGERREDVPLLARSLLRRRARKDAPIGARFFAGWDGVSGEPRLAPALVRALIGHAYRTHVRELDALLLQALVDSRGATLELTDAVAAAIVPVKAPSPPPPTTSYSAEQIRAALAKHDGVRERAWRDLGMSNRYVLKRLMKKYGLAGADD